MGTNYYWYYGPGISGFYHSDRIKKQYFNYIL